MKRASLTLRKPAAAAAVEDFINAAEDAVVVVAGSEPSLVSVPPDSPAVDVDHVSDIPSDLVHPALSLETTSFRQATRSVTTRKTKPSRRRATVYFDLDVTRALARHCIDRGLEMSVVVNEAVRRYLRA